MRTLSRVSVTTALAVTVSGAALLAADLKISSPAFAEKGQMAAKYSFDGASLRPPRSGSQPT